MFKIIAFLKKVETLSHDDFLKYWYEKHSSYALKQMPKNILSMIKKYVQNHSCRLGVEGEPPYDGVAELHFEDLESIKNWNKWYFSHDAKLLREDEEKFMDRKKSVIVVVEEKILDL